MDFESNFDDYREEMDRIRVNILRNKSGSPLKHPDYSEKLRVKVEPNFLDRRQKEARFIDNFDKRPRLRLDYKTKIEGLKTTIFDEEEEKEEEIDIGKYEHKANDEFKITIRVDRDALGLKTEKSCQTEILEKKAQFEKEKENVKKNNQPENAVEYINGKISIKEEEKEKSTIKYEDSSVDFKNERIAQATSRSKRKSKQKRRKNKNKKLIPLISPPRSKSKKKRVNRKNKVKKSNIKRTSVNLVNLSPTSQLKLKIRTRRKEDYEINEKTASRYYEDILSAQTKEITISPEKGKNNEFSLKIKTTNNVMRYSPSKSSIKEKMRTLRNKAKLEKNKQRKMLEFPFPQIIMHSNQEFDDLASKSNIFLTQRNKDNDDYDRILSTFNNTVDGDMYKIDFFSPSKGEKKERVARDARELVHYLKNKNLEKREFSTRESSWNRLSQGGVLKLSRRTIKNLTKKNYKKLKDEQIKEWKFGGGRMREVKDRMQRSKDFSEVKFYSFIYF